MKINFAPFFSYIFVIAISVLFMLFLDGPGGSYLTTALILALVISLLVLLWTKKTIAVHTEVSEDILNKGDSVKVSLSFKKSGFIPTCFIKFRFAASSHFMGADDKINSVIIFGSDEYTVDSDFKAFFFGTGTLGSDEIILTDYFGIFMFKLRSADMLYRKIKIYPDIPEINSRDDFAGSLTDAVSFDDSEETSQSMISINGVPGYEHRRYEAGDSLKLINWKLSAKRGELLVRKLEGTGSTEQTFVLIRDDLYFEESQLAAEAMLGMAMIFAKAELPVRIIIYMEGSGWQEFPVANVPDLFQLRYKMTDYVIIPAVHKLGYEEARLTAKSLYPYELDGDRAVIFAPVFDEKLTAFIAKISQSGIDYQGAVCKGMITDKKFRRIERDNLNVRFSD